MKVLIYRNLNRSGYIYSIKSLEGISKGRVIGYAPRLVVENAELVVSQAGRERVLRQRRKNVHAGVVGELVIVSGYITRMHVAGADFQYCNEETFHKNFLIQGLITYNPFQYKTFVHVKSGKPIFEANRVIFDANFVGIQAL